MTAEELLMSDEVEVFQYSNVIEIDGQSRHVNVPIGEDMFGVEGDENVTLKHFTCPKIVGNNIEIDLSDHNLYVNYTLADEKGNPKSEDVIQSPCENIVIGDDNITFDWKISEWVTKEDGYIAFSIVAKKSVDGVVETRWYTTPAVGKVLKTVKEGRYLEQQYPDVIDNLMNRVSDLERILANGGGSIVVDDALSETSTNPVQNKVVTAELGRLSEEIADLSGGSLVEPKEDDIPKVFFSEAIPQTKTDTVTEFRYISKTKDVSGYAEFKAQGNSSMSYPKKNVTVKMYADEALEEKLKVDFKGWGEQRKHVYKANWIDLSHARNVVSARLWADVVKSRANYLSLPELLRTSPNQGAVDGFPIKVYSQGIYQGRYTLNIPKDAWMANMDDSLDTHCILCSENYASGCFRATANINGSDWTDEVHDAVPTSIKTRWNEVISFVMNSTDEEFKANLGNYFFVDSLIDYLIFGMVSCGLDAFGKNQLYFTYDGIKWIASMYDMDSTWGLYWNGSKFVSASYSREEYEDFVSTQSSGEGNLLYIRLAKLFYAEIQARYAELKQGALSVPNIINHFERFTDIVPLDLVKEDYASTTGSGKFTGIPSQSTNNIQQIRKFVIDRYAYCDEYFASLGGNGGEEEPDTPENPEATLTSISATYTGGDVTVGTDVNSLTGITVTGTYSDGSTANITNYTLSGTIAEGSNTITVSYGGKTTTISVVGVPESAGTLLYSLSNPKTFTIGTSMDTEIKLFDEPKDFTILMDADLDDTQGGTFRHVFHCVKEENPWPGLNLMFATAGKYNVGGDGSTGKAFKENIPSTTTRLAITCSQGLVKKIAYYNNGSVDTTDISNSVYMQYDGNLMLGCSLSVDGTKGGFWQGTINRFDVHNYVMSDDEITAFLIG